MQARKESQRLSSDQSGAPDGARRFLLYNIQRLSYAKALSLQREMHARCAERGIPGMLILLEHDPVITMGVKTTSKSNLLVSPEDARARGIEVVDTDRGGDVTYHGPGQLVGYPILPLRELGCDLHGYLRALEQTVIDTLARFGLEGTRNGPAGVWVGDKKVCSIGIAVRKWVTYHGFAVNVSADLSHFRLINPCGLASEQITSLSELLGAAPNMDEVRKVYAASFARVLGLELVAWSGDAR